MHSLPDHFRGILGRIEPPESRKATARDIPAMVRNHLRNDPDLATREPHTLLVGSYARSTAIRDIKDVDVLVILDHDTYGTRPLSALEDLWKSLDGMPDTSAPVTGQRRSVRMDYLPEESRLDVVPCLAPDGVTEPLRVPDRPKGKWIDSHPLGYADALSKANAKHGRKLVPLVKLLKHWRDHQLVGSNRPKSYWLEAATFAWAGQCLVTEDTGYAELFTDLVAGLSLRVRSALGNGTVPRIADPMLRTNLTGKWDRTNFSAFATTLQQTVTMCEAALGEDDRQKCMRLWRDVFGPDFRPDDPEKASSYIGLREGGRLAVTREGRVTAAASAAPTPVEAHRFHGYDS